MIVRETTCISEGVTEVGPHSSFSLSFLSPAWKRIACHLLLGKQKEEFLKSTMHKLCLNPELLTPVMRMLNAGPQRLPVSNTQNTQSHPPTSECIR